MPLTMKVADKEDFHCFFDAHEAGTNRIRQRDIDEWFYFNGTPIARAMPLLATIGVNTRAILDEGGRVVCLFGSRTGIGWLIGTELGRKRAREIHRLTKAYVQTAEAEMDLAFTIFPEDDKWHRMLGFEFVREIHGGSLPVYLYERNRT